MDPVVAEAFAAAAGRIAAAGAVLGRIEPPGYEYGKSRRAGLLISEVETSEIHAAKLADNPEGFSKLF
ncbi:hypothetical protein RSW38_26350, partial [Escherichia coli]|nr:hypothetical protein [Escherichia coli]